MKLLLVLASAAMVGATSTETQGMQKVIDMITKLKETAESNLSDAKQIYSEVACSCKDESKAASDEIVTQQTEIDTQAAETEAQYNEEMLQKGLMEAAKAAQEAAEKQKAEDIAEYQAASAKTHKVIADLVAAKYALSKAIDSLKSSKTTGSFLKVKDQVQKSILLAEVMGFEKAGRAKTAFLQMDAPGGLSSGFHSGDIISTLEDLLTDFDTKKNTATKTQEDRTTAMNEAMTAANALISAENQKYKDAKKAMNDAIKAKGDALEAVKTAKDILATENQVLIDLTHQCEVKAREFDLREKTLTSEADVFQQVLDVLGDAGVADKYKASEDHTARKNMVAEYGDSRNVGLVNEKVSMNKVVLPEAAPVAQHQNNIMDMDIMFLQKSKVLNKVATLIKSRSTKKMGKEAAVATLRETKSAALGKVADKIAESTAKDVFKKVKKLIQDLIERLLTEARAEATKKGFCDTQIGKTTTERDYAFEDVKKINNKLADLEAKLEAAENTITEMGAWSDNDDDTDDSGALGENGLALKEATDVRAAEKAENVKILRDNAEAIGAVKSAITVLKEHFASTGRNQLSGSASLDNTSTAAVQGSGVDMSASAETGNQEGGKGAIMMLENILNSFQTASDETKAAEKEAYTLYTEYARSLKVAIAESETTLKNAKATKDLCEAKIAEGMDNLKIQQDIVDAKVKLLQDLRPQCVDTGMSYAEKKAKLEAEVCALDKAAGQLDPDGLWAAPAGVGALACP